MAAEPQRDEGGANNVHNLFRGVDGLLTEDQLRRLRMQLDLVLDIERKQHELAMQIQRDQDELRQRRREYRYEHQLRYAHDRDKLRDLRWNREQARVERYDRHLFENVREATWAAQRLLMLLAAGALLYALGRSGIMPADALRAISSLF